MAEIDPERTLSKFNAESKNRTNGAKLADQTDFSVLQDLWPQFAFLLFKR